MKLILIGTGSNLFLRRTVQACKIHRTCIHAIGQRLGIDTSDSTRHVSYSKNFEFYYGRECSTLDTQYILPQWMASFDLRVLAGPIRVLATNEPKKQLIIFTMQHVSIAAIHCGLVPWIANCITSSNSICVFRTRPALEYRFLSTCARP